MAVEFQELNGSPRMQLTPDGWAGQREGKIAWQDIDTFIAELMPPTVGQGTLAQGHAIFPGKPWMILNSMDIVPWNPVNPQGKDSNGVLEYDLKDGAGDVITDLEKQSGARISLTYVTMPFDPTEPQGDDPVPFLSRRWTASFEFLQIPGNGLLWASDSTPATEEGGINIIVANMEHILTWHFVTDPPFAAIRTNLGAVNDGTFLGAADQTLLFAGASVTREVMSNGERSHTMEYRFIERMVKAAAGDVLGGTQVHWNHAYRSTGANAGKWDRVRTRANNVLYPQLTTFGDLFKSA